MSKVLVLNSDVARQAACRYVMEAPNGYAVKIAERTRSLDQNAAQWPILDAFAKQLQWPVNGAMQTITAEDWKDILTCAWRNEVPRVAMGLSGGMVLLGQRTSRFKRGEFSEWLDWLNAMAVEKGVQL